MHTVTNVTKRPYLPQGLSTGEGSGSADSDVTARFYRPATSEGIPATPKTLVSLHSRSYRTDTEASLVTSIVSTGIRIPGLPEP